MHASLSALLLVLLVQHYQPAKVLQGPDIIGVFEGQTVVGAYADGLAFRETYEVGGAIAYWDPRGATRGQWSVVNNLLCTFYEDLAGACFRIEQASANCFDYFAAADSEEQARGPAQKSRYTARGAVKGRTPTCPDELQARNPPAMHHSFHHSGKMPGVVTAPSSYFESHSTVVGR